MILEKRNGILVGLETGKERSRNREGIHQIYELGSGRDGERRSHSNAFGGEGEVFKTCGRDWKGEPIVTRQWVLEKESH